MFRRGSGVAAGGFEGEDGDPETFVGACRAGVGGGDGAGCAWGGLAIAGPDRESTVACTPWRESLQRVRTMRARSAGAATCRAGSLRSIRRRRWRFSWRTTPRHIRCGGREGGRRLVRGAHGTWCAHDHPRLSIAQRSARGGVGGGRRLRSLRAEAEDFDVADDHDGGLEIAMDDAFCRARRRGRRRESRRRRRFEGQARGNPRGRGAGGRTARNGRRRLLPPRDGEDADGQRGDGGRSSRSKRAEAVGIARQRAKPRRRRHGRARIVGAKNTLPIPGSDGGEVYSGLVAPQTEACACQASLRGRRNCGRDAGQGLSWEITRTGTKRTTPPNWWS